MPKHLGPLNSGRSGVWDAAIGNFRKGSESVQSSTHEEPLKKRSASRCPCLKWASLFHDCFLQVSIPHSSAFPVSPLYTWQHLCWFCWSVHHTKTLSPRRRPIGLACCKQEDPLRDPLSASQAHSWVQSMLSWWMERAWDLDPRDSTAGSMQTCLAHGQLGFNPNITGGCLETP